MNIKSEFTLTPTVARHLYLLDFFCAPSVLLHLPLEAPDPAETCNSCIHMHIGCISLE